MRRIASRSSTSSPSKLHLRSSLCLTLIVSFAKQDGASLSASLGLGPSANDEELALALSMSAVDSESAFLTEFDQFYGLVPPQMTVLVRAYSDDSDDRLLAELEPRFVVMYEPSHEFIRRIEVIGAVHASNGPSLTVVIGVQEFPSWSRRTRLLHAIPV